MQTLEPIVAKLPLFAGMKEEHLALIAEAIIEELATGRPERLRV